MKCSTSNHLKIWNFKLNFGNLLMYQINQLQKFVLDSLNYAHQLALVKKRNNKLSN